MKALLWKDFCILRRQLKLYVIAVLIMAVVPNLYLSFFAVVYGALIPYNTIALDEQSGWGRLAAMMPYSTRALALSKYVTGWLFCGCCALLALIAGQLEKAVSVSAAQPEGVLLAVCLGAVLIAISLPFLFRFGVAKGRMVTTLLVVLCCGGAGALSALVQDMSATAVLAHAPLWIAPVIAVAANVVSVAVSERVLERKRG